MLMEQNEIFQFPQSFALSRWDLEQNGVFKALWKNKNPAPSPGRRPTLSFHTKAQGFPTGDEY